jgi:peptidyl-prolyl cis-trans isomerase D
VKPGELVPNLVETQLGYHIIKRDDASKDDIAKAYKQTKSLDLAKTVAAKIAADLKAGKSGDDAVKAAIAQYGIVKPAPPKADVKPPAGKDGGAATSGDAGAATAAADAGPAAPAYTAETDPERPQLNTSSAFNRGGDPIPAISGEASQAVTSFAFGATAKAGDVAEPIRTDDGFLVISLKEQKPATKEEFEKERDQYMQQLLFAKKAEALGNYTRRLRETSKSEVKIDESNVMGAKSDAGPTQEEDEGP